jgi:hypothetical protein
MEQVLQFLVVSMTNEPDVRGALLDKWWPNSNGGTRERMQMCAQLRTRVDSDAEPLRLTQA